MLEVGVLVDTDGVFGFRIERLALLQLAADVLLHLFGRHVLQQGTFHAGHTQMAVEHLGGSLQVDGVALTVEIVHVVEEAGRAAAAAEDDLVELGHLVEHRLLEAAEALLATLGEELRHLLAHARLDVPVEVVEGHARDARESMPHSGLSGSHIADEDDAPHVCLLFVDLHNDASAIS